VRIPLRLSSRTFFLLFGGIFLVAGSTLIYEGLNAAVLERAYVEQQRSRIVLGDPGEVRETLLALQEKFAADEIMVITITGDYESRRASYRLLAAAFS